MCVGLPALLSYGANGVTIQVYVAIIASLGFQALAPVNLRLASTDFLTNAYSGL